jgi:hypothetical protein
MKRKTKIKFIELYALVNELGADELLFQLEQGEIVNNSNPEDMVYLSQIINQKTCQCNDYSTSREAGTVIHSGHVLDPDFKFLVFWNKEVKAWSIISDKCSPDKELRDACMIAAKEQFNVSSDNWYQLLSVNKRQRTRVLESEVWLVDASDIKTRLINLDTIKRQDPKFISLKEACDRYSHMTHLTQLAVDRLLEIRGEDIKH